MMGWRYEAQDEDFPRLDTFLLARYDEEEVLAKQALAGMEPEEPWGYGHIQDDGPHLAYWSPWRVLDDLVSKRKIVAEHPHKQHGLDTRGGPDEFECGGCSASTGFFWCRNLLALAQPYRSHKDFDDSWSA